MEANFRLKNNSSVLAREDDYEWFIIVNPVLLDTNGSINAVSLDTPLATTNMDEFNCENEVGDDIQYNDASFNKQERESESFCENIRKGKNATVTCANKVVVDANNKKRLLLNHTKNEVCLLTTSSYKPVSCWHQQVGLSQC